MKLLAILCFIALVAHGQNSGARPTVQRKYDRFQDRTLFNTRESFISARGSNASWSGSDRIGIGKKHIGIGRIAKVSAFCECNGNVERCPADTMASIRFQFNLRRFRDAGITFLADGKRVPLLKEAEWYENVGNSWHTFLDVVETGTVVMSADVFRQLLKAQLVEVQIGKLEFSLTEKNLATLRVMSSTIAEAPETK
jgi:hypothetical protein